MNNRHAWVRREPFLTRKGIEPLFKPTAHALAVSRGKGHGNREVVLRSKMLEVPAGEKRKKGISKAELKLTLNIYTSDEDPLRNRLSIQTGCTIWRPSDRDYNPSEYSAVNDELLTRLWKAGLINASGKAWWKGVSKYSGFDFNQGPIYYLQNGAYWFENAFELNQWPSGHGRPDRTADDAKTVCLNHYLHGELASDSWFKFDEHNIYEVNLWAKRRFSDLCWSVIRSLNSWLDAKSIKLGDFVEVNMPFSALSNYLSDDVQVGKVIPDTKEQYMIQPMKFERGQRVRVIDLDKMLAWLDGRRRPLMEASKFITYGKGDLQVNFEVSVDVIWVQFPDGSIVRDLPADMFKLVHLYHTIEES